MNKFTKCLGLMCEGYLQVHPNAVELRHALEGGQSYAQHGVRRQLRQYVRVRDLDSALDDVDVRWLVDHCLHAVVFIRGGWVSAKVAPPFSPLPKL